MTYFNTYDARSLLGMLICESEIPSEPYLCEIKMY